MPRLILLSDIPDGWGRSTVSFDAADVLSIDRHVISGRITITLL